MKTKKKKRRTISHLDFLSFQFVDERKTNQVSEFKPQERRGKQDKRITVDERKSPSPKEQYLFGFLLARKVVFCRMSCSADACMPWRFSCSVVLCAVQKREWTSWEWTSLYILWITKPFTVITFHDEDSLIGQADAIIGYFAKPGTHNYNSASAKTGQGKLLVHS